MLWLAEIFHQSIYRDILCIFFHILKCWQISYFRWSGGWMNESWISLFSVFPLHTTKNAYTQRFYIFLLDNLTKLTRDHFWPRKQENKKQKAFLSWSMSHIPYIKTHIWWYLSLFELLSIWYLTIMFKECN